MLQTGQIEAKYQVSRDTLRFYIDEGLVVPDKVAGKSEELADLDRQQADLDRRRASLGALADQLRQRLEV